MVVPESAASDGSVRLFDVAQVAVAVLDAQGVVTGWTQAAERLTGYAPEEVMNRPAATLLERPEDRATARDVVKQSRAKGDWHGVVAVRRRDGHRMRLAVQALPLLDPMGSGRWALLARDEQQAPGSELGQMMLEPLLAHSPVGVAVLNTDLRYVWVNDVLTYGGRLPREQRLGRRPSEVLPHNEGEEEQIRQVLETGEPALNVEYFGPTPLDLPRKHAWWECIFRLEDSAGRVLGVWLMAVDNTERWRARERLALLTEASAHIGSTLDVARTAQELAEVAVPRFADVVTVDLLESVLRGEEPPPGPAGEIRQLRRAAQQSIHDGHAGTAADVGDALRHLPTALSARCLNEGAPVRESLMDPSASTWYAEDPTHAAAIRSLGIHSVLVMPVQARGVRLGVATFLRSRTPNPFDQEDVSLAAELVARAAVCVDNARRFTRERKAALTLQQSLLPHGLHPGPMLEVASRYLPAKAPHAVGGDWFDVIPLSGARVALVVGDVVGHGTHAAVTMARLRAAVRTLADLDLPPDELLAHLDDLALSMLERADSDPVVADEQEEMAASVLGATCLYAVYDPVAKSCTLARAGHLPPAVVNPDGTVAFPELPTGPPLGLGFLPFESTELDLPDGSMLALFTNGLLADGDRDVDAGLADLAHALAHSPTELEDACEHVIGALLAEPRRDDAALLLARTHGFHAGQVASWDLACDPATVADARKLATGRLTDWGLEELEFTTELVISELVTNAIRYGAEPIRLRLIRKHEALICEVSDGSSTSPRLRHARTTDEGGRGLFLVAQLTRRWGTRYATTGKIIWAEQPLPASAANPSNSAVAAGA